MAAGSRSKKRTQPVVKAAPQPTDINAESSPETTVPWGPVAAVIVALFLYIFGQLIGGFLATLLLRFRGWSYDKRIDWLTNTVVGQFWYVLVFEVITLAGVYWFVSHRKGTPQQLGLTRPKWIDIGYAVVGFVMYYVGLVVAIYLVAKPLFPKLDVTQHQDIGFSNPTGALNLTLAFISLVILPPIVEEIVFRGFLFAGLKRKLPVLWAGLLTSILFAAPHLLEGDNGSYLWIAAIDTFVLSLALVWIRQKTGRLYGGMLLHATKNFLAFWSIYAVAIWR